MAEAEAVQQFVELLKLEQASLTSGRTDALPEYAEQKIKLATQLNSLAAQRKLSMTAQGFDTNRAGVEAWCSKHASEMNASSTWSKILSLAGEAQELNRLNGELIKTRLQYNARALEALHGGKNSLDLYGPDGQSTASGNRRINDAV